MCSLFKRTLAILVSGSHSRRIRLEGSNFSPSLNLYKNSCSSKTYIKYYFFIRVWRELPILLLEFSEDYCSFIVMAITSFIVIIELTTLFLGMVLQLPHTGFGRSHLFPVETTLHLMVGWNGDWFGKEEVLPLKKQFQHSLTMFHLEWIGLLLIYACKYVVSLYIINHFFHFCPQSKHFVETKQDGFLNRKETEKGIPIEGYDTHSNVLF